MAASKVLLIGWDAADWKVIHPLMDAGRMPNLRRLVRHGAAGQIATLHPPLSPMLWTSVATGKRAFQHGIHGFAEPTPDGLGIQPITNLSRRAKALWNILNQNQLRSVVVGWWPSHPAEPIDGVMVSDLYHRARGPLDEGWPLLPDTVHPPELAATLAGLRIHPDCLTPAMVEPFIPLAREIDQNRDQRLAQLMRTLAECMSIQSAASWLLDAAPWDFFAVYLDSIDHFCHSFMRYHPPRQSWIAERDYELYHNVVSMAYEFHDRMLGELLRKAGPETTVILLSDHGFHPDHLRPARIPDIPAGPAVEHRDCGILAMSGPPIRPGETLYGASLLDIAPTVLTLYGLPVAHDMEGKVLVQAFAEPPQISAIASWETVPGADGRHPPYTRLDPVATQEALEQMIALGYIERADEDAGLAVVTTIRELRFNLGEAFQDAARHPEALRIFTELHAADPDEQRFAVRLFASCQALGLHAEMRRIVDDLDGRRRKIFQEARRKVEELIKCGVERAHERREPEAEPERMLSDDERSDLARWRRLARYQPAVVDYLKAQVLIAEQRYDEALAALERVHAPLEIADLYGRLGRASEARQAYREALASDPDNANAHLGLCRLALHERDFEAAVQSALDALERNYGDPQSHYLLGLGLRGLEQFERSAEAFQAALAINPNFPEAHFRLAGVLQKRLGDPAAAREHRLLARRMRKLGTALARAPVEEPQNAPPRRADSATPPTAGMPPAAGLPRSDAARHMQKPATALPRDSESAPPRPAESLAPEMPPVEGSVIALSGPPRSDAARHMQKPATALAIDSESAPARPAESLAPEMPPVEGSVIVLSGLPRSDAARYKQKPATALAPDPENAPPRPAESPAPAMPPVEGSVIVLSGLPRSDAARHMQKPATALPREAESVAVRSPRLLRALGGSAVRSPAPPAAMPPVAESVIVVTGLPRSGTSMLMQMLAAGGVSVLSDNLRKADEDNPRGYFELDRVKSLLADSRWLVEARGKAIKIVLPLLPALSPELACRVVLAERDIEEVLDSQQRMLARRNPALAMPPERRCRLKEEYGRALDRAKAALARRPLTRLLVIEHRRALANPLGTAEQVSRFLGGGWDVARMAGAIDATLHRNRATGPR